jgi:hypothetical protein
MTASISSRFGMAASISSEMTIEMAISPTIEGKKRQVSLPNAATFWLFRSFGDR